MVVKTAYCNVSYIVTVLSKVKLWQPQLPVFYRILPYFTQFFYIVAANYSNINLNINYFMVSVCAMV